jgi:hypothetical protein
MLTDKTRTDPAGKQTSCGMLWTTRLNALLVPLVCTWKAPPPEDDGGVSSASCDSSSACSVSLLLEDSMLLFARR